LTFFYFDILTENLFIVSFENNIHVNYYHVKIWRDKCKRTEVKGIKVNKKYLILALLFLILNMVIATQYAITKVGYEYYIVHPCNADIRYIGSDNSTDNIRVLRVISSNVTNVGVKLRLGGNFTTNQVKTYTAAFGIVNEEGHPLNITHINVSSGNHSYLKIWLHGNRAVNAKSNITDPSAVFMWNNNTLVNASNTTAWTLAAGNSNPDDMCYNVSDRANCSINTTWDEIACVRYSINDTNATSNISDFVWVQVAVDIPDTADFLGLHTGTIWIHLEKETEGN